MPRTIEISVSADRTNALVEEIERLPGLIGLRVQRAASLRPPGDVITALTTTRSYHDLVRLLDRRGIGGDPHSTVTTTEPVGVFSAPRASDLAGDASEAAWEEMEAVLAKEGNMTANGLALMALSGVIAAVGIATGALHVVVGAMVIAPGFEPIVRVGLGAVARGSAWRRGASHTAAGYGTLILAAALTALALRGLVALSPGDRGAYLPAGSLLSYWTTTTATSLLVGAAASLAGAVLIAANRSVLTAGVMIALALVPSAAIVGVALAAGDPGLAGRALLRWAVEVALVLVASVAVFAWKRARVQRRDTML